MDKFFSHNTFVIDENIQAFKLSNAYKVYDAQGQEIGAIQEHKSFARIMLGMFLADSMMPFELNILNADGKRVAQLKRGMTLLRSKVRIYNETGAPIGTFKHLFSLMKPKFILKDNVGKELATIKGDWKAWNFEITDANGQLIGKVDKKWNGVVKEFFTTADQYVVNIEPRVTDENQRIAIASVAAAIDMVLKEG
ncbi:MAG: LURP-one-related family protein [Bacteroidaceae bacterium]|nr:LURP-one-related family protein [Bacteroidaceae bacterium]